MRFIFCAVLLAVMVCLAIPAMAVDSQILELNNDGQYQIGDGYQFFYQSVVLTPGLDPITGITFDEYSYTYHMQNLSTNHGISSWTCPFADTNALLAQCVPLEKSDGDEGVDGWSGADLPTGLKTVDSIVTWDDGHKSHCSIYTSVVPEPASILALAVGFTGLVPVLRRRKARI